MGIVELRKTTWGAALPVGTTVFSLTIDYEMGMFPPDTGTLNGVLINGITCYTPPAHENFECERNFTEVCTVKSAGPTGHEIKIGEGNVYAWKSPLQVYIPDNRKSWAISMAVSHSLLTNLVGFDIMSINEYFATAIQESNAGCEGSKLIAPGWVTSRYPSHDTDNPIFCYDKSGAVAVGYFQQEMGGSWVELDTNYPCFIPQISKDDFTGDPAIGSSFEFQSIVKAYHDYRNIAYWQYVKCWNPIEFFKNAKDPYAAVKTIGMAYNQGMNHNSFEEIFSTDRTAALEAENLMDRISPGTPNAANRLYAEQINRLTKVLDNKVSEINWADAAVFGVKDQSAHSFREFYDAAFTWEEVEEYIKKIVLFYTSFGVEEKAFIAAIKPIFDSINGGTAISFRYQMSEVIEAIVINLPAFDPKKGLAEVYGGSGANSCFAPTARMEGYDAKCGEDLSLKFFFSGKAPYTFSYKRTDASPEVIFAEITTSQNPYTITPVEEGTYALTAVRDNVSAGEVVCEPIAVKYGFAAAAKLSTYGNPCDGILPGIQVEITSNTAGPYLLEYENEGVTYTASVNSSPYILMTAPAPLGTYHLTKISAAGCDLALDETIIIDWFVDSVFDAKLLSYGEDLCLGTGSGIEVEFTSNFAGPYKLEYEIDGVIQPLVTLSSSPNTLMTAPAPLGTYHLTKVSGAGCEIALDETITIDKITPPVFDAKLLSYGEDFCLGTGSGVVIEFSSSAAGPYIIEYEVDGVPQAAVTLSSSPYTLMTAPAPLGTYHLTKVTVSGCEIALDETITIDKITPPVFDAKLLSFGEDL
ncbi:hypothetical protein, partial [Flavobacterium sp. ACN6]|uniref:hypothetical protein n=1 Tax=Flavobacterium sp. ACN6 TaxID=1920426 RepID=UPI001141D94E